MVKATGKAPILGSDDVRRLMLDYFYGRNLNAGSPRGKKSGAAVSISVVRAELKSRYGLRREQVVANLTYLISQGWVEEKPLAKTFSTPRGGLVPSVTIYYVITAKGIDKIEGPGEFTVDRFQGVKIEAAGQNIITVGDGNRVDAKFAEAAQALADLKAALRESPKLTELQKVSVIGDIDSIQSQLAKPAPNRSVISMLWTGIEKIARVAEVAETLVGIGGHFSSIM